MYKDLDEQYFFLKEKVTSADRDAGFKTNLAAGFWI